MADWFIRIDETGATGLTDLEGCTYQCLSFLLEEMFYLEGRLQVDGIENACLLAVSARSAQVRIKLHLENIFTLWDSERLCWTYGAA